MSEKLLIDKTFAESLEVMRGMGAGMSQAVIRDKDDKPLAAVIIVDGADETQEILQAIEDVSRDW